MNGEWRMEEKKKTDPSVNTFQLRHIQEHQSYVGGIFEAFLMSAMRLPLVKRLCKKSFVHLCATQTSAKSLFFSSCAYIEE